MLKNFFEKKKYGKVSAEAEAIINPPPSEENLWVHCTACKGYVYEKQMRDNLMVCPKCGHHLRIGSHERIRIIADEGSFESFGFDSDMKDPIDFPGYREKWEGLRRSTGLREAILCGYASIKGEKCVLCVMDSTFLMGSMGSILGEFTALAFERATEERLPVVIFTASGGARMQEGIISLMQMAKVSAVVRRHSDAGLLYLTVVTDPTTGGVTASFASLGDIIIGETGSIFGFAGRRVIEQTIGKKLPAHFQTTQFALSHGLIDGVYDRSELRDVIGLILKLHNGETVPQDNTGFERPEPEVRHHFSPPKELKAWDRITLARNNKRPSAMFYIKSIFDDFVELHGDRLYADDPAVIGGIAYLGGSAVTVIAEERGTDTRDRQKRNFGMPNPEGYRKALRLMQQAEKFNRPVICLVDTQGAYCGDGAEERGQGGAIAANLSYMSSMTVPVISAFIGEGGSGGALAIGVANKVLMQENAVYSILSPEGFAAILWKDASRAKEAAEVMKMTASELHKLGVVDVIIPEPEGGAGKNPDLAAAFLKDGLLSALNELLRLSPAELRNARYDRFRKY